MAHARIEIQTRKGFTCHKLYNAEYTVLSGYHGALLKLHHVAKSKSPLPYLYLSIMQTSLLISTLRPRPHECSAVTFLCGLEMRLVLESLTGMDEVTPRDPRR